MIRARILIAEDEEVIRDLLVEILTDEGFDVFQAETGDAAAVLLRSKLPQLLLTNINMPGSLDGIGLAHLARQLFPNLPVIIITGRPIELQRASSFPHPKAVFAKPFSLGAIVGDVQRLVGWRNTDA